MTRGSGDYPSLKGYEIVEKIYQGTLTEVYRALRQADRTAVVLKFQRGATRSLTGEPSSVFSEQMYLHNQYAIAKNLIHTNIVRHYGLEPYGKSYALVMEDSGGVSLARYLLNHLPSLEESLAIALQLGTALDYLHQNRIVHKDIKPANISIHPETQQVKLLDFSIALQIERETTALVPPNQLEGTLAYLSPEQTGRMNRVLDYRSDFYSLGVTLYETLAGQLPFTEQEALALVYCHLSRKPAPLNQVNPDIPEAIAQIVAKLMAKNAEDRYQSAAGLIADLQRCSDELKATGTIQNFETGQLDRIAQLNPSEKLYGREKPLQILRAAFERARKGTAELVAIGGYSGIGKTALIREAFAAIAPTQAFLVSGKFEQFKRDIPYAGLTEALRGQVRQILSGDPKTLNYWRDRLQTAVGNNGQPIVDVIPELELLLGQQPPVPELPAKEARDRYTQTLLNYMLAIASPEYPAIFFMDDLQWADSPSLQSLCPFLTNPDNRHRLIVIAYRDNEVDATHPVIQELGKMQAAGVTLTAIALEPLSPANTTQLIADSLGASPSTVQPLADLLHRKTQGNPFFLRQLLESLHSEGLLRFDFALGNWQWDLESIQQQSATENVVDLMAGKLQKLPIATQTALQIAACIGNRFDLNSLAAAGHQPVARAWKALWEAIQQGSILPLDRDYRAFLSEDEIPPLREREAPNPRFKFLHDRVQQAAYDPISPERKQAIHLAIARFLQKQIPECELESRIFEMVDRWNHALPLIAKPCEQKYIARLNYLAGRKAKAAAAYDPALKYFQMGIDLLACQPLDPKLLLALQEEIAETAYLCGQFARAEAEVEAVLAQTLTPRERIKAYEIRIQSYIAQHKLPEALQVGRETLHLLGVVLPDGDNPEAFKQECANVAQLYADRSIASLIELPSMSDPDRIAILRILGKLWSAAFLSGSPLTPFIVLKQVEQSLKYGHRSESPFAFATYGAILLHAVGDGETGYQFGKLALNFLDNFGYIATHTRTAVIVNNFIFPWKEHPRSTLMPLADAHKIGIETGDIEFASYAAAIYSYHAYFVGQELESLAREMAAYAVRLEQLQQLSALAQHNMHYQTVLNLLGRSKSPVLLVGEAYDETTAAILESHNYACIFVWYFNKLVLNYLFEQKWAAVAAVEGAEDYLEAMQQLPYVPAFYFYCSLIHLEVFEEVDLGEQDAILKTVAANQQKMQTWAERAPMNFRHKFDLVAAECCRVSGNAYEAMELYDRAIAGAMENDYIQEAALANELAARFYCEGKKPKIGRVYLQEAHQLYQQWGAAAKVKQLEERYPHLLEVVDRTLPQPQFLSAISSSSTRSELLDLTTIIKATEAISSELLLDRLLARLLSILLENAGAQKGCILLVRDGELWVEVADENSSPSGTLVESIPLAESYNIPQTVVHYVARTREALVIANATTDVLCRTDTYVLDRRPLSLLCAPILHKGELTGLVYLENNLAIGTFTRDRLEIVKILMGQAAIALENTRLYQTLQESETKFRAFVEEVNDVIYSTDLEGNLTYLSPQFQKSYGYEVEEYLNSPFSPLVHPDDLEKVMAVRQQIFATGEQHAGLELRILHQQGYWLWTTVNSSPIRDEGGKIMGLRGISRDISDRKRAEAQLRESELFLRNIYENVEHGICVIDVTPTPDFIYVSWNPIVERITRIPSSEITGKNPEELLGSVYGAAVRQKYECCLEKGTSISYEEFLPFKEQETWWVTTLSPLKNSEGRIDRIILSAIEITDRKQAERLIQEKNEELEQALVQLQESQARVVQSEKMSALGNLIAGVAHEINNPVGFLNGSLSNAKDYVQDLLAHLKLYQQSYPEPVAAIAEDAEDVDLEFLVADFPQLLDSMQGATARIAAISNSLRIFSRADSEFKVSADLHAGLDSTLLILKYRLKANEQRPAIEVVQDYGNLPPIECFPGQLNQAFMNILANAIDMFDELAREHSFEELAARPLRIAIRTELLDEYVCIYLGDNGKGMNPETRAKIFDRLFTTKAVGKGTGLGLTIAQQIIVEKHSGTLNVRSQLGEGTEFEIILPR